MGRAGCRRCRARPPVGSRLRSVQEIVTAKRIKKKSARWLKPRALGIWKNVMKRVNQSRAASNGKASSRPPSSCASHATAQPLHERTPVQDAVDDSVNDIVANELEDKNMVGS